MSVTSIHFADVSSLTLGGTVILGVQSLSINLPADVRPLFSWGTPGPVITVSSPSLGSGSVTYISNNVTTAAVDFKTSLDGSVTKTCVFVAGNHPTGGTNLTQTLTHCKYQAKSEAMSARQELLVTISFTFIGGM